MTAQSQQFSQIGGMRYGERSMRGVNATSPFARLTATEEWIEVAMRIPWLGKKFQLMKDEITRIERYGGLVSTGLLFKHSRPGCPPFLLFWTPKYSTLKTNLETLGYVVHERPHN